MEMTDFSAIRVHTGVMPDCAAPETERSRLPIGVFDSGVGGISVLRELVALMPGESFIFYGDSAHAPYGTKSLEEVRRLTFADAERLMRIGIKALVVACNTATSAAVRLLRERYAGMPVIGIEPALKPAVLAAEGGRVLVMATPMTLQEEKFHALLRRFLGQAKILTLPCPGLMEYVEAGVLSGPELERFLTELLAEYRREPVDCVVLGCTHYPFVREAIQEVLGSRVQIFDGGAGTARETRRRLEECGLFQKEPPAGGGEIWLYNSLGTERMNALAGSLLQAP